MYIIKQFRKFKIFLKKNILDLNIPLLFNQGERKFYKKNKEFWREKIDKYSKNKKVIVVEYVHFSNVGIGTLFFASILSVVKKSRIIAVVTNPYYNKENFSDFLYYSFPNINFYFLSEILDKQNEKIHNITSKIYNSLESVDDILNIKYNNLLIGDLIHDSSQILIPQSASVWKLDDRVFRTIFNAIALYEALENINNDFEVINSCSSHCVGLNSLIIRYFSFLGVESYAGAAGLGPISKYKSFNNRRIEFHFVINEKIIEKILNKQELKSKFLRNADQFLEDRINGKGQDEDSNNAFSNKKVFDTKEEFKNQYGLKNNNQIVFIMLHAFNDYPNHYEQGVYRDYYIWFIETLKKVKKLKNINWIFKAHPSSINYPNDANLSGIFEVCNEDHILFLNHKENFSTKSLINICDHLITCTGTAGLELSCYGIPCLLTQPNHYSNYNICELVNTEEEYFDYLEKLNLLKKQKRINYSKIEKSKILFYIFYNKMIECNENFIFDKSTHSERKKNDRTSIINQFNNREIKSEDLIIYKEFISNSSRLRFWTSKDLISLEEDNYKHT